MPTIYPDKLKRQLAYYIVMKYDYELHRLDDPDLFKRVEELGYYWDDIAQDWRSMPDNKVQDER